VLAETPLRTRCGLWGGFVVSGAEPRSTVT